MIISLLVAMDQRRGIGRDNGLPWRLSSDLKRFRELTMGHAIVVGRKTYESIGRPLPGRFMIVVTRNPGYDPRGCMPENCQTVYSVRQAIDLARDREESELFICGGAQIFAETLPMADRIYLTEVHAVVDADTFFPAYDESRWVSEQAVYHEADEKNEYPFTFKLLVRPRPGLG
ncbi:MAG TPA: dihydrofolate reductase [Blastocatellia bacterium]|nr:dihydrofolate reductase [Blastocatellia bacterium]